MRYEENEITWGTENDDIVFYLCFIMYYFGKWCCHSVSSLIINEGFKNKKDTFSKRHNCF